MAKTGRNDPCPCGSGHKYKVCCLKKDEAAEHERVKRAAAEATVQAAEAAAQKRRQAEATLEALEHDHHLAQDSNAVIALVKAGKLDEAETAARELLVQYPYVHDGYDRLGMVYEARGQNKQAADCYRKVIEFVQAHPADYDPDFADTFHRLVAKLDPSPAS
jgi:tetratricopeptide (TPR) repeat protein